MADSLDEFCLSQTGHGMGRKTTSVPQTWIIPEVPQRGMEGTTYQGREKKKRSFANTACLAIRWNCREKCVR